MRDASVGHLFRMMRLRSGWSQVHVARRAGISPSTVSRIENGEAGRYRMLVIRAHGDALGLRVELQAIGRGAEPPRLLDEEHAAIVEHLAVELRGGGWVIEPEASFSVYGERGRVDILAYHPVLRILLIVEVKTELAELHVLFGSLSVRDRLAPVLARERGWDITGGVATLVALADTAHARRMVAQHSTLFERFERHGGRVRGWLRRPRPTAGSFLLYVSPEAAGRRRWLAARRRVRSDGT